MNTVRMGPARTSAHSGEWTRTVTVDGHKEGGTLRGFWVRVDAGGHRARAKWTRHLSRDGELGSLCGKAYRAGRYLLDANTVGLQGEKRECRTCARLSGNLPG